MNMPRQRPQTVRMMSIDTAFNRGWQHQMEVQCEQQQLVAAASVGGPHIGPQRVKEWQGLPG